MVSKLFQLSLLLAGVAPAFASPVPATHFPRAAAAVDELVGYGAGTTGGGSSNSSSAAVTSCSDLESALKSGGVVKISGLLSDCGILDVASDTTVLGVGSDSGLTGGGLRLKKVNNVIIRNLKFSVAPAKGDLVGIEQSTQVWVDHCDFSSKGLVGSKDDYDGLLDIKRGSDKITVSWNKFSDHWKASLVGHSDSNESQDSGKLHVTYHHNNWDNVSSRTPSIRFGTLHVYSSCYNNIPTSGIHTRMGAQALIEQTSFSGVNRAIVTNLDSKVDGFAIQKNNIFSNSTLSISQNGTMTSVDYDYTTDAAADACSIIAKSAGVGVIG